MRECDEIVKKIAKSKLNVTKLAILLYLSMSGWVKLGELSKALNVAKSTAWKHVKELQERGLVKTKYSLEGHPQMLIAITDKGLKALMEYVGMIEKIRECLGGAEKEGEGEE